MSYTEPEATRVRSGEGLAQSRQGAGVEPRRPLREGCESEPEAEQGRVSSSGASV
jgi:hypothetical protein